MEPKYTTWGSKLKLGNYDPESQLYKINEKELLSLWTGSGHIDDSSVLLLDSLQSNHTYIKVLTTGRSF